MELIFSADFEKFTRLADQRGETMNFKPLTAMAYHSMLVRAKQDIENQLAALQSIKDPKRRSAGRADQARGIRCPQ